MLKPVVDIDVHSFYIHVSAISRVVTGSGKSVRGNQYFQIHSFNNVLASGVETVIP